MKYFCLLSLFLLLNACNGIDSSQKINVAAAASTQYALDAIIEAFEKKHALKVNKIISSSGKLTAQIEHGAPVDLFISADQKYPNYLTKKKQTIGEPKVYAKGSLVLWTYGIQIPLSLDSLQHTSIKKIAIADPKTAPYGLLSVELLRAKGLLKGLQDKLVYGESIAQVNQYVSTQAVEIGLTAKSIIMAPQLKEKGRYLELSDVELKQSMVLIQEKGRPFFEFMQSETAQQILVDFGYKN